MNMALENGAEFVTMQEVMRMREECGAEYDAYGEYSGTPRERKEELVKRVRDVVKKYLEEIGRVATDEEGLLKSMVRLALNDEAGKKIIAEDAFE